MSYFLSSAKMRSLIFTIVLAAALDTVRGLITYNCDGLPFGKLKKKFVCHDEDDQCLASSSFVCDYYLDPECPNNADQWTGLCDNLCPMVEVNETRINSFKCDGGCEEDFLKWCDGKQDCKDGADEAHCDCKKNPVDCSLDWKDRWTTGDYLKIILPIVGVLLVLVLGVLYGLFCKNDE